MQKKRGTLQFRTKMTVYISKLIFTSRTLKLTCDFSSEKYHRALREAFPNFDNVIDLQISDVLNTSEVDQEKSFFIELRIKNNADVPVYLFKDYLCFKRINPTIVDADLDTVRLHCILFDCVGEKQLYLPSDLIEIEPQDTRKVKAQKLNFYLYDAFVPGTYKVKIMYEYELPHYIPEPDREYAEMEASIKECYCKALRGSFHSNWFQWTKTNFEARFFV